MRLIEPISAPVSSLGVRVSTGKPCIFSPGPSCTKLMMMGVLPRTIDLIGLVPLHVYWLKFSNMPFMFSRALSSLISCTNVATIVCAVPLLAGMATWISPFSAGFGRLAWICGACSFLLASRSMLWPKPSGPV